MRRRNFLLFIIVFLAYSFVASAQLKVAVIPFSNLDGDAAHNNYCYALSDSLHKALLGFDSTQQYYTLLSLEEVENAFSDLGIDPNSPDFDGNKWEVVKTLKCDRVITGGFKIIGSRYVINAFIYYPDTQLSEPDYQAKDVFKKEEKILESVPIIVRKLTPYFTK